MDKIKPPNPLSLEGNVAENWRKFKQRFELYLAATEYDGKDDKIQCSVFLHTIGDDALEVYNTFEFASNDDRVKLDVVTGKFEDYCNPRKYVTFERYKFFTYAQGPTETIDQYVTELKVRSKSCEFGALNESLIKDRIVCGIISNQVRERLLREPDLNLKKAVDICRAAEVSKAQMKSFTEEEKVHAVKKKTVHTDKQFKSRTINCKYCGSVHEPRKCPAFGKSCKKCNKKNHFAKVCRSQSASNWKFDQKKKVHTIEDSDTDSDNEFLVNTVANASKKDKDWIVKTSINNKFVNFKIDTGSQCNILSKSLYDKISSGKLAKSKSRLVSYSGHRIDTTGKANLSLCYKGKYYVADFEIVSENSEPILGLSTCLDLKLVKRVNSVSGNQDPKLLVKEYEDLFHGLGCLPGIHHIEIDKSVKPVVHPPRRVPFALKRKVKHELEKMEREEVIEKIEEPTDWVNSMVVVEKPNKVRICLDPRDLNRAIKRPHYPMKTVEEVATQLNGATIFSKLDASSGFWTIKLDEESSKLTTFNTPFGRYKYKRLPMGISSSPEVFQRTVSQIFENIDGVDVIIDDILIWGKNVDEHNRRLKLVLDKARSVNIRLNRDKCKIGVPEVTYIGHTFSKKGVTPDQQKVKAINDMPAPKGKKELQRFMGMINYVGKFIPNLSTINKPLRELLENKVEWHWTEKHEECFNNLKILLTNAPVLKYFDTEETVTLSVDASSEGIGACILQKGQPVSFASVSLNESQRNYAQIEKELLAIVYGCQKFHQYIYGRKTDVETDHKPLESLFKKSLANAPKRIQRMMLKIQCYDLDVKYKPGTELYIADTLSRAASETTLDILDTYNINTIMKGKVTDDRLDKLRDETSQDSHLRVLRETVLNGWPNSKSECNPYVESYWNYRDEITIDDGLLLKNDRIIIPVSSRKLILEQLHSGHLGIEKTRMRARDIVFWPCMNVDIADMINKCEICNKYRNSQCKEPLLPHEVPSRPWQKVGMDLFEFSKHNYLLIIDYYSKFIETTKLPNLRSSTVIELIKPHFARHGIPETVISDNGTQFSSSEFKLFAKQYNFNHITSSPRYSQSNGMSERAVQTIKRLFKKSKEEGNDPYLALLELRNTPIQGLGSPTQLLFGRRTRSILPTTEHLLKPQLCKNVKENLRNKQKISKDYYDKHSKHLQDFKRGENVRVQIEDKLWKPAIIQEKHTNPRSYTVETPEGQKYRRNRKFIRNTNEEFTPTIDDHDDTLPISDNIKPSDTKDQNIRTSSGRKVVFPSKYKDFVTKF